MAMTPVAQPRSGRANHKAAKAALLALSDGLPPPPATFDPAKQYRVRLTRTILLESGIALRPSQDVVARGDFAETNRDAISGAKVVG
jgi:hypothetical protein